MPVIEDMTGYYKPSAIDGQLSAGIYAAVGRGQSISVEWPVAAKDDEL